MSRLALGLVLKGAALGGGLEVPGAPTGLAVSEYADTQLTVAWAAPAAGGEVEGYHIQAQAAGGDWSSLIVDLGLGTELTTVVSGLAANTTYDIRVKATNAAGESDWDTLLAALTLPTAPEIFGLSNITYESITVDWTENGLTTRVYYGTVDDFNSATDWGAGGTGAIINGLASGTTYYFWLVSENASGDSAPSASASETTLPAP